MKCPIIWKNMTKCNEKRTLCLSNFGGVIMQMKKKLLDLVRDKMQYVIFHNKKHPIEMGKRERQKSLKTLEVKH